MADFQKALDNTMNYEDRSRSGIVTGEPGGYRARFGINSKAHPNMPESFWTGPANEAMEQAESVYRSGYWAPLQLDQLVSQGIANKLFDMAVNMGRGEAAILAQRAVNMLNIEAPQLPVDGMIGPRTLAGINAVPPVDLHAELVALSIAHYQHIEQIHPADVAWDGSWMARARA